MIEHSGGSSWKWNNIDKYRYQNGEFYLIGHSGISGKICEYWLTVDFNLSTGKLIIKKEFEDCEHADQEVYKRQNETIFKKGYKIRLQEREDKRLKFTTPKYKHDIYI